MICRLTDEELRTSQRVVEALNNPGDPSDVLGELWASAVGLGDALNEYQRQRSAVYRAARSAGFSDEQWRVLIDA